MTAGASSGLTGPGDALRADGIFGPLVEDERAGSGEAVPVAVLFIRTRPCPWHCVMCDLHRQALPAGAEPVPVPRQVAEGLSRAGGARHVKLYNAGSWFDDAAVPPADDGPVAALLRGRERVIVESHPALVRDRAPRLRDLLGPAALEVAMGLEAADEGLLERLGKGMTLASFAEAAARLSAWGIAVRAFVLVRPPFSGSEEAALELAERSVAFAVAEGATAVSLIPTRGGNPPLTRLAAEGLFAPPSLGELEAALALGLAAARGRARVFADLWDLSLFARCPACLPARRARLRAMNLSQVAWPRVDCGACEGSR